MSRGYARRELFGALGGAAGLAALGLGGLGLGALGGCASQLTTPAPLGTGSAPAPARRLFAVASDPWAVRTWATEMGQMPRAIMEFES